MDNKGRRTNNGRKKGYVSGYEKPDHDGVERRFNKNRRKMHRESPESGTDTFSF